MTQRVLVLGANGFIGRRLVVQLTRMPGVAVVAAGRSPIPANLSENIDSRVVNAADQSALQNALIGVTGVVNCIAGSPDNIVAGARALFAAAARANPAPRIVHLSSLAVYGSLSGAVDETKLYAPADGVVMSSGR